MNYRILIVLFGLISLFSSCCPWINEEHLGNKIYLSEYDNVDRRILFSKEKCSSSGTEIVPMTVVEYAYNSNWIIAKSGSRNSNIFQFWIIKNSYDYKPKIEDIKSNLIGPLNQTEFTNELNKNKIDLVLKKIE